jgi:hypothetical protein
MMFISALMMKPGRCIAFILTFRIVRTSVTLKVFRSYKKLRRRIFGKIMKNPLLIESASEAVLSYLQLMLIYGAEVFVPVLILYIKHFIAFPTRYFISFYIF